MKTIGCSRTSFCKSISSVKPRFNRIHRQGGFAPSLHQLVREKSLLRGDFPLLPLDSDVRQNVLRLCSSELFRQVDLSRLPLRSHFVKSDLIYCGTWCSSWNDCPYQSPGYPCPARNLN
jgi:hypothetical protein